MFFLITISYRNGLAQKENIVIIQICKDAYIVFVAIVYAFKHMYSVQKIML